ncbi:ferrochelatase [Dokdonella sp. MW10]|uniref:ferrochelatase n=1 Tax=Dokdonella sp. MW10 TaxID=2992926 RepID=UPI003F805097
MPRRTAVVLANLGTPDGPDARSVRRYLAEFLADPRIVEMPRWLWRLILHGVILRIRPGRSAHAYTKVWTPEGSPLQTGTRALADALDAAMRASGHDVVVRHAMRYGNPSIPAVMRELAAAGMQRLLVVPLFPQFSATTAASVLDAVGAELRGWRVPPELRFVNDYHDDPAHLDALARSVEAHWAARGRGERLVLSFHGIPERYVRNGDPYRSQCEATAEGLRQRLGLATDAMVVCFQSRVGREPWLSPYTDHVLAALPREGVRSIDILCPGFSIDCLETLEEIAMAGRDTFLAAGGERYAYIPSLNDSPGQVAALQALVARHLQGWPGMPSVAS